MRFNPTRTTNLLILLPFVCSWILVTLVNAFNGVASSAKSIHEEIFSLGRDALPKGNKTPGKSSSRSRWSAQARSTAANSVDLQADHTSFLNAVRSCNPYQLPKYFERSDQLAALENFQILDAHTFDSRLQQLGNLLMNDKSQYHYVILALVSIANASGDDEKKLKILQFLLRASGDMFETFPDLSSQELGKSFGYRIEARVASRAVAEASEKNRSYYCHHLQTEIDTLWRKELEEGTLQNLIETRYLQSGFLDSLRSDLFEIARSGLPDLLNMYIVWLRILIAYALKCSTQESEQVHYAHKVVKDLLTLKHPLERTIATERADKAIQAILTTGMHLSQ